MTALSKFSSAPFTSPFSNAELVAYKLFSISLCSLPQTVYGLQGLGVPSADYILSFIANEKIALDVNTMNVPSTNITSIRFSCKTLRRTVVICGLTKSTWTVLDLYSRYRLRRVLIEGSGYRR